jgi:hypothetical protein
MRNVLGAVALMAVVCACSSSIDDAQQDDARCVCSGDSCKDTAGHEHLDPCTHEFLPPGLNDMNPCTEDYCHVGPDCEAVVTHVSVAGCHN